MYKSIAAILLLIMFSVPVVANVHFLTKASLDDGTTMTIPGVLKGLETGPVGGSYEAFIMNAKGFKGDTFSLMNCTVHSEVAVPMVKKLKNVVHLVSVYYENDGSVNVATGSIAGLNNVWPEDGYVVKVNNKAKDGKWNLLKCIIK